MCAETAYGIRTGKAFTDDQILIPDKYYEMKAESLMIDEDKLVVPVRNKVRPHFRAISKGNFVDRIGRIDPDPSHNACVEKLLVHLSDKRLRLLTNVFPDDGTRDEQVIFEEPLDIRYLWGKEAAVRIPVGYGKYIQPDLAGRDRRQFHASNRFPSVIIEVIRTHPPDFDTFFCLLRLSTQGHIVVFHFIGPGCVDSTYNRLTTIDDTICIACAYYLNGGSVYKNSESDKWMPLSDTTDEEWYGYLKEKYWGFAMKELQKTGQIAKG